VPVPGGIVIVESSGSDSFIGYSWNQEKIRQLEKASREAAEKSVCLLSRKLTESIRGGGDE